MKVHVLIWSVCLILVFLLSGGALTLSTAGSILSMLLGAAVAGITFGAVTDAFQWNKQKRFGKGFDPLEALWSSIQLALSSICIALTVQSAASEAGYTIPYGLALLTPIACVLVWLATVYSSGSTRGFRVTPGRFSLRSLIMVVLFGVVIGVGANIAATAFWRLFA